MAFWVWTLSSACALVDATRQPDGPDDEGTGCEETQSCDDDPGDQGDDASDDDASAALTAIAGPSQTVDLAVVVALDGSATNAAGAVTAPIDAEVAAPAFTPDQDGRYLLLLVVSRDGVEEAWDVARVTSYYPLTHLEYRVVDAEYSRTPELERIVMVAEGPDRLYIHDPASGQETFVDLLSSPTSVSVSPDGTHAAVGHDGAVSYVSLDEASLVATYPVDTDVLDIVLSANRIAYATPRPAASQRIQCVRLTSGEVRLHGGEGLHGPSRVKLHPSGTALYMADSGVSPDDIHKLDIVDRTAAYLYDSRYHGEYDMCGNLWMTDDGLRIFTRCGNVFQSSGLQKEDIEHDGRLEGTTFVERILHLDHSSIASRVVAIPEVDFYGDNVDADTVIRIHDDESLAIERSIQLAPFLSAGALHKAHGRFVFISADGTRAFVVVQADEASGMLNDYAIVAYDLD